MPDPLRESQPERKSRLLLIRLLKLIDRLLDRLLHRLILDFEGAANRVSSAGRQLTRIWRSAQDSLRRVIQGIERGLSRAVQAALSRVGMFGESLSAKYELLSFDVREGAVERVLRRVNSILGSLAIVFHALHAAKEFKEHVEATMKRLQNPPEFIDLRDLLEQQ